MLDDDKPCCALNSVVTCSPLAHKVNITVNCDAKNPTFIKSQASLFVTLSDDGVDKVESAIGECGFFRLRMEFERDSSMEWGKWLPGHRK